MMRFSVAFLALFAVAFAPSVTEAANTCTSAADNDIVELACDPDNVEFFGTLCQALRDTGIDGSIPRGTGEYTVFAPVNSAFTAAGRRIGVTTAQKQATLQYHVVTGLFNDPQCGNELNTLLFWQGQRQTVDFQCTSGVVDKVVGDVNLPVQASPDPLIRSIATDGGTLTTGTPPRIVACNGVIYPINSVLGFDPIQYNWVFQPCAFNEPNCVRPVFAKGGKGKGGGVAIAQQNVGGLNFVSYTKKGKNWNFSPYQSFYANNAFNYFGPYNGGYGWGGYGPYYGGYGYKHGKGYGRYYGGYGYGGKGYAYGYGYGWRKNRRRQLEAGEDEMMMMEDRGPSAYDPSEYYEVEEAAFAHEEPASKAGDYYYNYRKDRNLRKGGVRR